MFEAEDFGAEFTPELREQEGTLGAQIARNRRPDSILIATRRIAMPQLDPYLFFDGTCAEAMRFYERTLGGKIEMMMTHADRRAPSRCRPA